MSWNKGLTSALERLHDMGHLHQGLSGAESKHVPFTITG